MDEGFAYAVWLLIEAALVLTGKGLVIFLSLGRWRGERMSANEGRIHSAAGSLSFKRDGQRVITANGLLFVGLAFYIALGALIFRLTAG